jgi:hypothetical protein
VPVVVLSVVAVALEQERTHVRGRAAASAGLVLAGTYLAVAAQPDFRHVHGASLVLEACLATALVLAFLRRPRGSRAPVGVLVGGCVMFRVQVAAYPGTSYLRLRRARLLRGDPRRADDATRAPSGRRRQRDRPARRPGDRSDALLFGGFLARGREQRQRLRDGLSGVQRQAVLAYNGSTCAKALDAIWRRRADRHR